MFDCVSVWISLISLATRRRRFVAIRPAEGIDGSPNEEASELDLDRVRARATEICQVDLSKWSLVSCKTRLVSSQLPLGQDSTATCPRWKTFFVLALMELPDDLGSRRSFRLVIQDLRKGVRFRNPVVFEKAMAKNPTMISGTKTTQQCKAGGTKCLSLFLDLVVEV